VAAESEGGAGIPSSEIPFLPAPPERRFCAARSAAVNSAQNRFGFGSINAPTKKRLMAVFEIPL